MKRRWRSGWPCLSVALAFTLTPVAVVAQDANPDAAVTREAMDALLPKITEAESHRHDLIRQPSASWPAMAGKRLEQIHVREAVARALRNNLTIESSRDDTWSGEKAILEAEAVFLPTFELSINHTGTETFRRARFGMLNKKSFQAQDIGTGGAGALAALPDGGRRPVVIGIDFHQQDRVLYAVQEIEASTASTNGPTRTNQVTAGISQVLPWGPSVAVSNTTTRQKIFYKKGYYWDDGMYSSTLTFSVATGVPGFKGFGPYSPTDASIKLTRQAARQAQWLLRATINDILHATDLAFWTLVQRLEELRVRVENRRLVQEQHDHVQRLFALQRATAYQKAEVEAELVKADIQEERARTAYLDASVALARLVEGSDAEIRSVVYLPFGYHESFDAPLTVDHATALALAREHRPELRLQLATMGSRSISLRAARNQARPDLSFSGSTSIQQDGSVYGYRDPWESLTHIARPDKRVDSVSLAFQRPWGNRAAESAVEQASLGLDEARLAHRDVEHTVIQEITDQLAALDSARVSLRTAEKEADGLRESLASLENRRIQGAGVNQNEILLTTRNLLSAELRGVAARIAVETAETGVLAAQGTLAADYGLHTAPTEADRNRIESMGEFGVLEYFTRLLGLEDDSGDESEKE